MKKRTYKYFDPYYDYRKCLMSDEVRPSTSMDEKIAKRKRQEQQRITVPKKGMKPMTIIIDD